jgi:hypothetical protein
LRTAIARRAGWLFPKCMCPSPSPCPMPSATRDPVGQHAQPNLQHSFLSFSFFCGRLGVSGASSGGCDHGGRVFWFFILSLRTLVPSIYISSKAARDLPKLGPSSTELTSPRKLTFTDTSSFNMLRRFFNRAPPPPPPGPDPLLAARASLNHAIISNRTASWWRRVIGYRRKTTPEAASVKREYRSAIALAMALIVHLDEAVYVRVGFPLDETIS